MDSSRYHIPNLERALLVMEYLARAPSGCGISEIAEALKLPKNSVFRILTTLAAHGYVTRDQGDKTFRLGHKLLALGYAVAGETNLVENALDQIRALRDETLETVLFGTLIAHEGIVLEQALSPQPIKVFVEVGTRFGLHTAAPGKAMLAFMADAEARRIVSQLKFTAYNARTITNAEDYMRALEQVRNKGYAVDWAEHFEGLHCVAAPVFDRHGFPVASIWITGPASRLPKQQFPKLGQLAIEKAQVISKRLGYNAI